MHEKFLMSKVLFSLQGIQPVLLVLAILHLPKAWHFLMSGGLYLSTIN